MPVSIHWYDSRRTIIFYEMYDRWTLQEFFGAMEEFLIRHPEASENLFFIVDIQKSNAIPAGLLAARERLFELLVQPGELTVLVGANRFAQLLVYMLQRFGLLGDVAFTDTIEAAETLIRQHPCYPPWPQ